MRRLLTAALAAIAVTIAAAGATVAAETVKIGVLKFGTVNWELKALKANKLDEKYGFELQVVPFAGEDATAVAMRAGEVDIIVTDWLDVSRARSMGDDLTFVPYSSSVGAIMVPPGSAIKSLGDLKDKKIGIAGGPLDKNWLMIQGLAKRDYGLDLASENEIVYGAPPLLAEKAKQGEVDAVLNFWHYCARLEAAGFTRLVSGADAAAALGAVGNVSALGYVFHEKWANEHTEAALGFVRASRATKALLKASDTAWEQLHADGVIKDKGAALAKLRDRFREGIPARPAVDEEADAAQIYALLAQLGGEKLVGASKALAPGTYWSKLHNAF